MPLTMTWLDATGLAVDGEELRPDMLGPLAPGEAARRAVRVGSGSFALGDLFRVEGDGSDGRLELVGDLRHVRGIGAGMASGMLTIRGDAGPRVGAGMAGGTLVVEGDADVYSGAAMRGGFLDIRGNAGDKLGAALPGDRVGMREGVIVVRGDAGEDVGLAMRRGLIAVGGRAGRGLGRGMVAGSIFAFRSVGPWAGAGMKRGTLALFGPVEGGLLPGFAYAGRHRPHVLTIYLKALRELGLEPPEAAFAETPGRYNGDRVEGGQGEILAWA